ncbi:MAG: site-2 protease family protein [Spirochaetota bacterium]
MNSETISKCDKCGTEVSSTLLSCPQCHRLLHASTIQELLANAEVKGKEGDLSKQLMLMREALTFLPANSKQNQILGQRIEILSQKTDTTPKEENSNKDTTANWKKLGVLGSVGLFFWKFKFIFTFLVTKGKLLLVGLSKGGTLLTMFASFGVYWTLWGWKFALGFVFSIYIHEMGHVYALNRLGIKASAPAFIPGLGAFVRMKQMPMSSRENARVGLAGPVWGLFASYLFFGLYYLSGYKSLSALAQVSAWINLFNLLPISPLDGGRGFSSMSLAGCALCVTVLFVTWYFTSQTLLLVLAVAGVFNAISQKDVAQENDIRSVFTYCLLIICLSPLSILTEISGK